MRNAPFLYLSVDLRELIDALFEFLVCRNVVHHHAVVVLLICDHIEVACTRKTEEDRLFLARLLALESFVDSNSDSVAALGRGKDTLDAGKLLSCLKDGSLLDCNSSHITVMIEL